MYLDFILLIKDYFSTLKLRIFIYEWLFPFLIGVFIFYILYVGNNTGSTIVFKNNAINLLGILAGFSITIITILTTGQSRNLEEIKKKETSIKIGNKNISLYRLLLVNFTYSVIIEALLIIFCLIYPIILENFSIPKLLKCIGFSLFALLTIHVLLLTIRNLTDFYFIITKKE